MKGVGLIGTGKHGSRYAHHIVKDIEGLYLAGIARRSELGLEQAAEWGTVWYPRWQELVEAGEVDVVIAVTPPHINVAIASACARLGKPLLLEKPLARNVSEAEMIVQMMGLAACPLTVGQTLRYNPVIQAMTRLLPTMGRIHSFYANQRIEPTDLPWHNDPEVAGAGMNTAVHVFDALQVLTGSKVARVMAKSPYGQNHQLEKAMHALVELENGVVGTVDVSRLGCSRSGRYEFVCEDGQLYGEHIFGYTETVRGVRRCDHREYGQVPTIQALLRDWLDFLDGRRGNPISGEDGLSAVRVCDACLRSAQGNVWVEV